MTNFFFNVQYFKKIACFFFSRVDEAFVLSLGKCYHFQTNPK